MSGLDSWPLVKELAYKIPLIMLNTYIYPMKGKTEFYTKRETNHLAHIILCF